MHAHIHKHAIDEELDVAPALKCTHDSDNECTHMYTYDTPHIDDNLVQVAKWIHNTFKCTHNIYNTPPVEKKLDAIHAAVTVVFDEQVLDQDIIFAWYNTYNISVYMNRCLPVYAFSINGSIAYMRLCLV